MHIIDMNCMYMRNRNRGVISVEKANENWGLPVHDTGILFFQLSQFRSKSKTFTLIRGKIILIS